MYFVMNEAGAYPWFLYRELARSISTPLDGMLVHRRSFPHNLLGFSWVETGTVRVECLTLEHNTVSAARAQTRTALLRGRAF